MKRPLPGKVDFLFATGVACALAAIVLFISDIFETEESRRDRVGRHIQADFQERVAKETRLSRKYADEYLRTGDIGPRSETVRLVLDEHCRLIDWNNAEWMPSKLIISDLCQYPAQRTIQEKSKTFYLLREKRPGLHLITLIPISIKYRIQNSSLPRALFLGRYQDREILKDPELGLEMHLRQVDGTIKVFDRDGNFVFCLSVSDSRVFSYPVRDAVLILSFIALAFLSGSLYRFVSGRKFKVAGLSLHWSWVVALGLAGIRALVFLLDFPSVYRPTDLFSPTVLAIGEFAPSLGDLLLNVLLLAACSWILYQEHKRGRSVAFRRALASPLKSWLWAGIFLVLSAAGIAWFFKLTSNLIQHSTIYFEFSNVFSLSVYSYIAFAVLGIFLFSLQLGLTEMFRFVFHFLKKGQGTANGLAGWSRALFSVAVFTASAVFFNGYDLLNTVGALAGFGMMILILGRMPNRIPFRLDLLNFLLILSFFSLLSTIGLVTGLRERRKVEMALVADRQSDEHDLITESLFERVVREVEAEAFLLDHSTPEGLSKRLNDQFFASSFKGYEVRIFVYDNQFELLDKTGDYRPYLFPNSDPGLTDLGRPTMTRDLYLVKYYKGLFESIYVGKFELLLRSFGRLHVWVELLPMETQPNRLYPNLLLDDNIRNKSQISSDYEYAVYKEGRLFRRSAGESFPLFYLGPTIDTLRSVDTTFGGYDNVFFKGSADKAVHVRHRLTGFFDAVNLFSFIFYFFVLTCIVVMMPVWLAEFIRNPKLAQKLSLKARIQVFFLGFAILPLFVVVFFLSPYIRAHLYRDIKQDLLQETQQVAGQIREDYLKLRRNRLTYSASHSQIQKNLLENLQGTLHAIEKTFFNDINVYSSSGELQLTTQPSIYELGLTSRYMNPEVFRRLRSGLISDAVIEDQIGKVTYFSAFYPIMNDDRRIVGFLNIPSYKNQDRVNAQSLSLLTLLVNIYVFIFLAIGFLAVLISNSIIQPLALLSRKLGDTTLGRRNEPLAWDSEDEIGEIIQAYNVMLGKLAESEQRLAQTERESAWQEMARQVAHEIKNPLTPMRLSVQHLVRAWEMEKPGSERLGNLFEKVTQTILVQIESLVNIANSFSQFAQMPEPNRTRFRLQDVVEEVAHLYSHDAEVQLDWHVPEGDFYVFSDRDQLSRVLNNLVKNASQAIEHEHGKVSLTMELMPDNWSMIRVEDNGKGIPEEIRARIFEPRFSTKNSGMGLGLAIVRKIIESCGGRIYFETEVGKGTTFFVELPATELQEGETGK